MAQLASCRRKDRYETIEAARADTLAKERRYGLADGHMVRLNVYGCAACDGYHHARVEWERQW